METPQHHLKYRPDIDGLRAFAVIAVIINHYFKEFLPSGYLGVDIFFVISGYVITSALSNRKHLSFNDFILDFYQRRIKRLLPALLLCVIITTLVGFLFIPSASNYFLASWRTGIAALFGFSNLYLLRIDADYFDNSSAFNLFTHTWSLGVEEQFYFLFPPIVWLAGFSRQNPKGARNLFYWVGMLSALSLASFMYLNANNSPASYFMMTSRFWELGAGCLVFIVLRKWIINIRTLKMLRSEIFLLALLATLFIPLEFQIQATFLVVLLTVLLIASLRPTLHAYNLLTLKPIVYIGLISYSLYLWHWSVLVISRWTIGIHWWSFPVQLGITFFLGFISYRFIERPLRQLEWSSTRIKTIGYGIVASMGCAAILIVMGIPLKGYLYTGISEAKHTQTSSNSNGGSIYSSNEFAEISTVTDDIKSRCNMTPHHLAGESYQPKPNVDSNFIGKCIADSKPKVILIGDSFAGILATHTALAAKDIGYQFKLLFGYGCPYPLNKKNISEVTKTDCEISPTLLKDELLRNINPGDIIIIRLYYPKTQYIQYSKQFLDDGAISAYDREIMSLYDAIYEKGGSLLLIGSNPSVDYGLACPSLQWFNVLQCGEMNFSKSLTSQFSIYHDLHLKNQYAGRFPNLEVISPTKILCNKTFEFCPRRLEGVNLYRSDNTHLSREGIDLIYPEVIASLHRLTEK